MERTGRVLVRSMFVCFFGQNLTLQNNAFWKREKWTLGGWGMFDLGKSVLFFHFLGIIPTIGGALIGY